MYYYIDSALSEVQDTKLATECRVRDRYYTLFHWHSLPL